MNSIPFYMLASSTMLILNKIAISVFQRPLLLLFLQLGFTSLFVLLGKELGVLSLSEFKMEVFKKFWLVPLTFLVSIFCNIKILEHSNVETFIVLRSSTPIIMSLLDVQFLKRKLPPPRSWAAIITVFIFSSLYIKFESGTFTIDSITWLVLWYANFCFDQIYIKHVVDTVKMTMWDRVLYTNIVPVFILTPMVFLFEEKLEIESDNVFYVASIVMATCLVGISMSYTSFLTRKQVSATTFTVIGNVCKFLTITINFFIWDNHATMYGLFALSVCVIASSFYKQAEYDIDEKDKGRLKNFYGVILVMFLIFLVLTIKG